MRNFKRISITSTARLRNSDLQTKKKKKVIERLRYDIDELIEMSKRDPETRDESVIGRLYDSVEKFEVHNPELTRALKQVLDFLSGSGI